MPRRPPPRRRRFHLSDHLPGVALLAAGVLCILPLGLALRVGGTPVAAPADLRLAWIDPAPEQNDREPSRDRLSETPVRGAVGSIAEIPYLVLNVGGSDAPAFLVEAHTSLGPVGELRRMEPGPGAGLGLEQVLRLPLAVGMRTLCLEVRPQRLRRDDAPDPRPGDNRLCRPVSVLGEAEPIDLRTNDREAP